MHRLKSKSLLKTATLLTALSLPVTAFAQSAGRPIQAVLALKPKDAGDLTTPERLALVNIIRTEQPLQCRNPEGNACERRVAVATGRLLKQDRSTYEDQNQRKAHRLLAGWARQNEGAIDRAQEQTAALRAERQASAAADAEDSAAAEVETETVTEQTSRSSSEDRAESGGDSRKLLTALGIIGAAAIAGRVLDNGDEVVEQQGDRLVVRRDGELVVRKDENELLRRPGSNVETRRFDDGSSRTIVTRENGTQVVTVRDADGNTIRRVRVKPDGTRVVLFDDASVQEEPIDTAQLDSRAASSIDYTGANVADLRAALRQQERGIDRRFSLRQIRNNARVRNLVPQIDLDGINFETGSAAIRPAEARDLAQLGNTIRDFIEENPGEVFLIEGHTDAVGSDVSNLTLSDRRAESVALALTEYFAVPVENLVVQGYGERFLKVQTDASERANRRATVRRITPLLRSGS